MALSPEGERSLDIFERLAPKPLPLKLAVTILVAMLVLMGLAYMTLERWRRLDSHLGEPVGWRYALFVALILLPVVVAVLFRLTSGRWIMIM